MTTPLTTSPAGRGHTPPVKLVRTEVLAVLASAAGDATEARLEKVPAVGPTVTARVIVACEAFGILGRLQVTVPPSAVHGCAWKKPSVAEPSTNTKPVGRASVKTVSVVASGPLFLTWYESVRGVLANGALLLADPDSCRSARGAPPLATPAGALPPPPAPPPPAAKAVEIEKRAASAATRMRTCFIGPRGIIDSGPAAAVRTSAPSFSDQRLNSGGEDDYVAPGALGAVKRVVGAAQ